MHTLTFFSIYQDELSVTHNSDIQHVEGLILDTVMVLGVEDSPVSVNNTGTGEEYRFTYNAPIKFWKFLL